MIPTIKVLGFAVARLDTESCLDRIMEMVGRGEGHIVTANAEILYAASRSRRLGEVLDASEMITADGMGVVLAAKLLGHPVPERVSGVELLHGVCQRLALEGESIFLLGSAPGVAETAASRLIGLYPGLVVSGTHHGYFAESESDKVAQMIRNAKPHFLAVAMGPRQEEWISRNRSQLRCPAMGVGGTLDIIAGVTTRAPRWMQRMGLEWFYRLCKEPRRLTRTLALPKFVLEVLKQRTTRGR
ncbi:MAG TPA: WecB/TagA/CpsF family glycosyltransferase [Bacillota bacterium]|nr:WecB/TagA/CpsF family glycosyltransferase [Bacillota bacterium]